MKIIEVNRPALSKPCSIEKGDVAVWQRQYMTESRIIATGSTEKPVYRLTKDFTINDLKFNLSMLIDSANVGRAEKYLEKVAKTVTSDKYQEYSRSHQPFLYLDERYKA